MYYRERPEGFDPKIEVVGCFVQHNDEIILLLRQDHKPQGNTWGIPSGKIDDGEDPKITVQRETEEETGLRIPEDEIFFHSTFYVRYDDYDFIYHVFSAKLDNKFEIAINELEHKDAIWISPVKALDLPLIEDLDGCIKIFFGFQG